MEDQMVSLESPLPRRLEIVLILFEHVLEDDVGLEVTFEFQHALDLRPVLIEVSDSRRIGSGSLARAGRGI